MANFAGTVKCILVSAGDVSSDEGALGAFQLNTSDGVETFVMWSGDLNSFSPGDQVMYNRWVDLLRQAYVSDVPVTVDLNASGEEVGLLLFGTD